MVYGEVEWKFDSDGERVQTLHSILCLLAITHKSSMLCSESESELLTGVVRTTIIHQDHDKGD